MLDCVTVGTDLATELPDLGFFILLPINFRFETDLHLFVGNLDITRCSPCLVLDHFTKAMRRAGIQPEEIEEFWEDALSAENRELSKYADGGSPWCLSDYQRSCALQFEGRAYHN
jgi:hypothetical protein